MHRFIAAQRSNLIVCEAWFSFTHVVANHSLCSQFRITKLSLNRTIPNKFAIPLPRKKGGKNLFPSFYWKLFKIWRLFPSKVEKKSQRNFALFCMKNFPINLFDFNNILYAKHWHIIGEQMFFRETEIEFNQIF